MLALKNNYKTSVFPKTNSKLHRFIEKLKEMPTVCPNLRQKGLIPVLKKDFKSVIINIYKLKKSFFGFRSFVTTILFFIMKN